MKVSILIAFVLFVLINAIEQDDDDYACPNGYFEQGNGECARCHAGFWCNGKTEIRCSGDMIAPREGMYACQLCPTPRIADFPRLSCVLAFDPPEECTPGMFVDENTGTCVICTAGYMCDGFSTKRTLCTADASTPNEWFPELPTYYYADQPGSTSCKVCELGTYSSVDGTMCLEMDQSPKISLGGCRKGYYHNKEIDTCRACPIGYYCTGYDENINPKQEKIWCDQTDRTYAPGRKFTECLECGTNYKANTATRFDCIQLPIDMGNAAMNEAATTAAGRSSFVLLILLIGVVLSYISYKFQKRRVLKALEAALL